MRLIRSILFNLLLVFATFSPASAAGVQPVPPGEAGKHLPNAIGNFRAVSPAVPFDEPSAEKIASFYATSAATRSYQSKSGEVVSAALVVTRSDSSAYALLTDWSCSEVPAAENGRLLTELGTKSCISPARISFARGPIYVQVEFKKIEAARPETLENFASILAPTLDAGEDQVPVLVKHLPGWPNVQKPVAYAVKEDTLRSVFSNQPVLDAVSFTGDAEAVVADYDRQRLVIVEFNTASLATDNDQRIKAKLQELNNQGQPTPTAYRRVGNYAVFVFDAPNHEAANQLIDQVKYQQVVQWLGENPFAYEQATREFTETTLGVLVAVVKASGLALVACLTVGGFFGALLFSFRRSQQRAREAYADSDAMLRLNLDDLTPESDPARLLGRGH